MAVNKYRQRFKSLSERFQEKVVVAGEHDCWEWSAGRIPQGYGRQFGICSAHVHDIVHRKRWAHVKNANNRRGHV